MLTQRKLFLLLALVLFAASASADTLVYAVSTNYNNFTGEFGTADLSTGAFNQIGPVTSDPLTGLVSGPNGNLLSVSASGNLDSINPASGAVSVVGAIPVANARGNAPYSIAELNGTVYATDLYKQPLHPEYEDRSRVAHRPHRYPDLPVPHQLFRCERRNAVYG